MVNSWPTRSTAYSIVVLLSAAFMAVPVTFMAIPAASSAVPAASPGVRETVLLDFSSPYCGPCQQMRPIIGQLKSEGYPIREVDVTREPRLASEYRVSAVPAFVLLIDGREVDRIVGRIGMAELKGMFRKVASSPSGLRASQPAPQPSHSPFAAASVGVQPQPRALPAISPMVPPASPPASDSHLTLPLIDSTVRLCVTDSKGKSYGTGTIILSRPGDAVILTCGHLFREAGGKSPVAVDLFRATPSGPQHVTTLQGVVLSYDLNSDVGLVRIQPTATVSSIPVAPESTVLQSGDPVVSVGCNHGQNPSAWSSRVTTIDRYSGASNIEATGSPVEGRSGGGLFSAQGQLIGVCFAADERGNEGLYSGLPSIHQALRRAGIGSETAPVAGLATVTSPVPSISNQPESAKTRTPLPTAPPVVNRQTAATRSQPGQAILQASSPLQPTERAALQELARRAADAEVTFIIRPNQPGARSQIITVDSASPEFVAQLMSAARTATEPRRLTTREVATLPQGVARADNMPRRTHRVRTDKPSYQGWSSVP